MTKSDGCNFMRKERELNPHYEGQMMKKDGSFRMSLNRVKDRKKPNNYFIKQCAIAVSLCSLVACASSTDSQESAGDPEMVRGEDCISQRSIRDYQVLDDKNLIVSAGANRRYHVELSRRAIGLHSNWSIGFVSQTGRICADWGEVLVDDGFRRKETIRLSSIREIGPDELDALLVQFGKKEPENEQTTEPEDVEGAEVEELD